MARERDREKTRAVFRQKYHSDPDKYKRVSATWAANNPDKVREMSRKRYQEHREVIIRRVSMYRKTDTGKAKINARNKARSRDAARATPTWFNRESVEAIYVKAAEVQTLSGLKVNVDHYYPLKGKTVCGLHVAENLRIITEAENIAKKNKHPEDWEREKAERGLTYPRLDEYLD